MPLVSVPRVIATLGRMARNPMEAWPAAVYSDPVVTTRLFGRTVIFVCDPGLIRGLFVDHADKLAREDGMRRALTPALGSGLLMADGAAWRWQRLAAAPAFRPARIEAYLPAMIGAAEAAAGRWQAAANAREAGAHEGGTTLDLAGETMRLSFEMMTGTLLAGDTTLDTAAIGAAIADYLRPAPWPMLLSRLGAPGWLPYPGKRRARRACRQTREAVAGLIARRRRDASGGGGDLLSLLLGAMSPGGQAPMGEAALIDNLLTFIAAGHETTALALFWLLQLLQEAPEVEAAMLEEMQAVLQGGAVAPGMIGKLPYTRQVVNEAMRLYPPAPAIMREMLEDVTLGGTRFPRGARIILPIYALHRHSALWEAPERFDPGRFAPAGAAGRDRHAFIPFGLGPRSCIGMGFALAEITAALAVLLPRFRIKRAPGGAPACRQHITLRPAGNTRVTISLRRAADFGLAPQNGASVPDFSARPLQIACGMELC